ncbi:spore coat protein GerQ [Robertmurraya andreesenii]|uniref:Spore germination protein Q n=1 Tax=Anoxybacillus andreesenii TaxID=1325932 RepID=A0ABT9V087_9BACL|nr:spore coat protein GerQ [Robertmurraya andreesenii]MDQ0154360.1 spore germination protein Q [Robertmurraya andreesenii]
MTNQGYYYPRQNPYGHQPYQWGGATGGQPPTTPPVSTGTMFPTPTPQPPTPQIPGMLPLEQSYIENIFRLNKGKLVTVYAMFDTVSAEGPRAQTFRGVVEAAGRDHLIISDPETGKRILLPMVYFGYAVFDEELDYEYSFGVPGATTYPPR